MLQYESKLELCCSSDFQCTSPLHNMTMNLLSRCHLEIFKRAVEVLKRQLPLGVAVINARLAVGADAVAPIYMQPCSHALTLQRQDQWPPQRPNTIVAIT